MPTKQEIDEAQELLDRARAENKAVEDAKNQRYIDEITALANDPSSFGRQKQERAREIKNKHRSLGVPVDQIVIKRG